MVKDRGFYVKHPLSMSHRNPLFVMKEVHSKKGMTTNLHDII